MPSVAAKAKAKKKSVGSTGSRKTIAKPRKRLASKAPDAIRLLKSDHRQVEDLFGQFEKAKSADRKRTIVGQICDALTVHARIEEEIFYPKAREALNRAGEDLLDEAEVEHEGIKWRVDQLKSANPGDQNYDARVTVLKEYVSHHVKEEESELFPKSRSGKK